MFGPAGSPDHPRDFVKYKEISSGLNGLVIRYWYLTDIWGRISFRKCVIYIFFYPVKYFFSPQLIQVWKVPRVYREFLYPDNTADGKIIVCSNRGVSNDINIVGTCFVIKYRLRYSNIIICHSCRKSSLQYFIDLANDDQICSNIIFKYCCKVNIFIEKSR